MKKVVTYFIVFLTWTLIGVLSKIIFLSVYSSAIGDIGVGDWLQVVWYGLKLDISIAGYLTIIPAIFLIANLWYQGKVMKWIWRIYFGITAFLSSLAYISNLGLYGYWGYPLDNTPLLYIKTSPADAMASLTTLELILFPIAIIVVAVAIYFCFEELGVRSQKLGVTSYPKPQTSNLKPHKIRLFVQSLIILMLTALLIIPIRGGVDTGTNHTGSVYFSDNIRLNHAAVNPIFSFIESVTHYKDISEQYRFMDDHQATKIFSELTYTTLRKDTIEYIDNKEPVNVILITLEGFSKYIMTESGHLNGITPCLDRLTQEGLYFTNIYASSYRTDRALVAVHSGFPAQPTMSIMDMPHKSCTLPSIARSLDTHGYQTSFYYGGDADYSNMRSYFMGTGFQKIISETDFSVDERTGKWGVHDGTVYDRLLSDINTKMRKPFFCAVMTESSHEPFDVPDYNKYSSPEENAFSYADSCLGHFIDQLKNMKCWKNTVVLIVPDHLGVLPAHADNYAPWRYQIPLLIIGGAVKKNEHIPTIGSQVDIAATLLALLGFEHNDFTYSKDLLDPHAPHYAFFAPDDAIGFITDDTQIVNDNVSGKLLYRRGLDFQSNILKGQAFLQKLYDDIDKR